MNSSDQYDVVIVGAGPVGASLAACLRDTDLRIALVDRAMPTALDLQEIDHRVFAITRASERILTGIGAWDEIADQRISPYAAMHVWDAASSGEIHFEASNIGQENLGHIIENKVLTYAIHQQLAHQKNVTRIGDAALATMTQQARGWTLQFENGQSIQAGMLIGADGAHSQVRTLAGMQTRGWAYQQQALVSTVSTEFSHEYTAWQRFLPTGPLAFLPLSTGQSSIVWSVDSAQAEALLALDEVAFRRQLGDSFDHRLGDILASSSPVGFDLHLQHTPKYIGHRLALVGDAAHSIHPLAGQGVNLGLLDAASLAEVILTAMQNKRDFAEHSELRKYERWRKGQNLLMMGAMDGFKRLFGSELPPVTLLRSLGMHCLNRFSPVKNHIIEHAMGLRGDLPRLARGGYL